MKRYFVNYYRDFANTYSLRWSDTQEGIDNLLQAGYEQITRKEAIRLSCSERDRRRYDQSCSGYADSQVFPWDYDADKHFGYVCEQTGYIVEATWTNARKGA